MSAVRSVLEALGWFLRVMIAVALWGSVLYLGFLYAIYASIVRTSPALMLSELVFTALIFFAVAAFYVKHDKETWFCAFTLLVPIYNLYVIWRVVWYVAGRCVFRAPDEPRREVESAKVGVQPS